MNAVTVFACFMLLNFYVQTSSASACVIEGLKDDYGVYTFQWPINDTFQGVIGSFKTRNVLRMRITDLKYLNATWEDQTLTFSTSDRFKDYEKENPYTTQPRISVEISAVCTEDTSKSMTFRQPIVDTNNHYPFLNKKRYDYVFGMRVPEGLKLTDILPIKATDYDITNNKVYFSIEENEYVKLEGNGKPTYYQSKEFTTTLTALKNLTAPFNQTFTLVVKDDGHPVNSISVPLVVAVSTPEELEKNKYEGSVLEEETKAEEKLVHPPVFAKHLYFADYTSDHQFKMEEPIVIKYGAEASTKLKQKGQEDYFKVRFETHERLIVEKVASLPDEIIKSTDLITIEIEAVNAGLNIPGRTALLIRLPSLGDKSPGENSDGNSGGNSKECGLIVEYGNSSAIPLVLFLLAVFCIVFINIYVAVMFINKNKLGVLQA